MSYTKTFIPFPPLPPVKKEGVFIFNKKIVFSEKEYKIKSIKYFCFSES